MEDLPNYDNFTGPGTILYPDPNPCYNDSGEPCCPVDCEWDFLNSLDFDWMSQPVGSLSTDQPPEFATEVWSNQLDMSLIGNFEDPALPVDLEQPLFMPPTTLGHFQNSLSAPPSSHYSTRNVSASAPSMSNDFLSIPSTQDTPFPVPIPQSPDTSASPLYTCDICSKSCPNPRSLKRHQKLHLDPVTCPASEFCTHRSAEKRDMERHVLARHPGLTSVRQYLCPENGCEYAIKGFGRQDHLGRHIKRKHSRVVP